MYAFKPSWWSTSFHVVTFPLYSTIRAPLGIIFFVNKPLPAPGKVDFLLQGSFPVMTFKIS